MPLPMLGLSIFTALPCTYFQDYPSSLLARKLELMRLFCLVLELAIKGLHLSGGCFRDWPDTRLGRSGSTSQYLYCT